MWIHILKTNKQAPSYQTVREAVTRRPMVPTEPEKRCQLAVKPWMVRACKGRRPAIAGVAPRNKGAKSVALTALHLKFLVPPLEAINLGLLVSKELLKFVLDRLGQLVQFRALQDLLQHRRHVDRAGDRGGSGRRSRNGEERRRRRGPRSLGCRLRHLARCLARARPTETQAAGPWEIESRVNYCTRRAAAPASAVRAQSPEAVHPGNPSSEAVSDSCRALRFPAPFSTRFQPRRLQGNVVFPNPFREPNSAPPSPLPPFSPPPGSPCLPRDHLSARWRHIVPVNLRSSLKRRATLLSQLRDAMGRPLWRLLDTGPLEGIGPGRAGRQTPGYRHALNGARKGGGW